MKAIIFDLDGTLIDTVYAQVLAWQKSFATLEHLTVPAWCLHQKIGLDGKLLAVATGAELARKISSKRAEDLDRKHSELMKQILPHPDALPGAIELLADLRKRKVPHGIATSSKRKGLTGPIKILGSPKDIVVICPTTWKMPNRSPTCSFDAANVWEFLPETALRLGIRFGIC
jgi:phosphoglycolate phosphatase-like HAD superfamily hydrolase